jgi:hypothetical protein
VIGGVYRWYFRKPPASFDIFTPLYTGISPKGTPQNGRGPNTSGLRERIRTHYAG